MMQSGFEFRTATREDFPRLIKMWQECFNDSPESAGHIFKHLQKPENILVLTDENKPAAMLSVLDFSLVTAAGAYKAAYIYGVAASPEKQGKGLGTAILDEALTFLRQKGYACAVLVPASESLFDYYGKRGYKTAFHINKVKLTAAEIGAGRVFPLEKLDAAGLGVLRGESFGDSPLFALWHGEYLEYVVRESEFYGGGTFAINLDGAKVAAVCHKDGGTVYVKELAATQDTLAAAIRSIHAHFGADEYRLYLRADFKTNYENCLLPFAMIKWYDNEVETAIAACGDCNYGHAYIAHVLD